MNISPFLSVNHPCDEGLQWTKKQLLQVGLRPIQTFDLHTARLTLQDCSCPHHGTNQCDCQMIVLLVYGNATDPATLILHGNDGLTWISLAENPNQRTDEKMISAIKEALEVKAPISISQG